MSSFAVLLCCRCLYQSLKYFNVWTCNLCVAKAQTSDRSEFLVSFFFFFWSIGLWTWHFMMSVRADIPDMGSQSTESWLEGSGKGEKLSIWLKKRDSFERWIMQRHPGSVHKWHYWDKKDLIRSTLDTNNGINNVK